MTVHQWRRCRGPRSRAVRRIAPWRAAVRRARGARPASAAGHRYRHRRGHGAGGRRATCRDVAIEAVLLPALRGRAGPVCRGVCRHDRHARLRRRHRSSSVASRGACGDTGCAITVIANAHHDPANVAAIREAAAASTRWVQPMVFPGSDTPPLGRAVGTGISERRVPRRDDTKVDCARGTSPDWVDVEAMRGCRANPRRWWTRFGAATVVCAKRVGRRHISDGRRDATADEGHRHRRGVARSSKKRSWRRSTLSPPRETTA